MSNPGSSTIWVPYDSAMLVHNYDNVCLYLRVMLWGSRAAVKPKMRDLRQSGQDKNTLGLDGACDENRTRAERSPSPRASVAIEGPAAG